MKLLLWIALAAQVVIIGGAWAWNHVHHPMGNQLAGEAVGQFLSYGRLCGLFAAFGALLQILLIGRVRWIERGVGFDRLSRLHHVIGFALLASLLGHPLLLLAGHAAQAGVSITAQLLDFVRSWDDVGAALAALLMMLAALAFSAVVLLRRLRYEVWYATHLTLYLAVALAFGHQLTVGSDFTMGVGWFKGYWIALYCFVLINLLWHRVGRLVFLFIRHRFSILSVEPEVEGVTSVRLGGRRMDTLPIQPGQFMIVRFLARGFRWEAHPFSLSGDPDGKTLRLSIKALGDFTRRVPQLRLGTRVIVDGPHGGFTARHCANPKVLLVAGGIGITPIRALAGQMAREGRDAILLYANRNRATLVFEKEFAAITAAAPRLKVTPVLSHEPEWPGERGVVDRERIGRLVPDVKDRDVFLCGPPPMMKMVWKALVELGVPRGRIHWERFAL
jgi:predicted ferric reductase